MSDITQLKCPICGTRGPIRESTQMLRCSLCRHTDQASAFKEVGPIENIVAAYEQRVADMSHDLGAAAGEEIFSVALDHTSTLTQFYPPDDIVAAVQKIDTYFRIGRGAKEWAYGPIQSRDESHPNLNSVGLSGVVVGGDISLPVIRRMAAAFQCNVIKPLSAEGREELIKKMRDYLDAGDCDAKVAVDIVLNATGTR